MWHISSNKVYKRDAWGQMRECSREESSPTVFLSYCGSDAELADRVVAALTAYGERVYIDKKDDSVSGDNP